MIAASYHETSSAMNVSSCTNSLEMHGLRNSPVRLECGTDLHVLKAISIAARHSPFVSFGTSNVVHVH